MALPKNAPARVPPGFEAAFRTFLTLPNVGKATAEDLVRLRIRDLKHLARQNPLAMYRKLCRLDNARHDPCVIDVFMAVVDHARTGTSKPWWKYTPERKAILQPTKRPRVSAKPRRRTARRPRTPP